MKYRNNACRWIHRTLYLLFAPISSETAKYGGGFQSVCTKHLSSFNTYQIR